MRWTRAFALCLGILVGLCRSDPSAARPDVTLWVVQPPGEVVAFDFSDFSRVGGVRIPPTAFNDPSKLSINGVGQILVQLDDGHLWIWDGASAKTLSVTPDAHGAVSRPGPKPPPLRRWLLGDDGGTLFVLEATSRQQLEFRADTLTTTLRVRATDLFQRAREQIFAGQSPPCQESEEQSDFRVPCPDPAIWAPGGVVRDYFVLSRCEENAQLAQYRDDFTTVICHHELWVRSTLGWRASEVGTWGDLPLLDVGANGSSWAQADKDGGCCGAENVSSNQMTFANSDTSVILFDEWSRFHNQNSEVSFFTATARIAPGSNRVAFTVHATASAAATLPPASGGHPDTLELPAIHRALAELPLVEIDEMQPGPVLLLQLTHAELVGWASDSEVVVVEKGRLVLVDVVTKRRRESGIAVRSAADATVVWR